MRKCTECASVTLFMMISSNTGVLWGARPGHQGIWHRTSRKLNVAALDTTENAGVKMEHRMPRTKKHRMMRYGHVEFSSINYIITYNYRRYNYDEGSWRACADGMPADECNTHTIKFTWRPSTAVIKEIITKWSTSRREKKNERVFVFQLTVRVHIRD